MTGLPWLDAIMSSVSAAAGLLQTDEPQSKQPHSAEVPLQKAQRRQLNGSAPLTATASQHRPNGRGAASFRVAPSSCGLVCMNNVPAVECFHTAGLFPPGLLSVDLKVKKYKYLSLIHPFTSAASEMGREEESRHHLIQFRAITELVCVIED